MWVVPRERGQQVRWTSLRSPPFPTFIRRVGLLTLTYGWCLRHYRVAGKERDMMHADSPKLISQVLILDIDCTYFCKFSNTSISLMFSSEQEEGAAPTLHVRAVRDVKPRTLGVFSYKSRGFLVSSCRVKTESWTKSSSYLPNPMGVVLLKVSSCCSFRGQSGCGFLSSALRQRWL